MEQKITGVMVYYYKVCKRKLWYFNHSITMENTSDSVALGKVIDQTSYSREEKHININDEINIDFIKSKKILHEVKKSKKIEEASIFQVKYYLYYLNKKGVFGVVGKIDYPLIRETREVNLSKEDIEEIENSIEDIKQICNNPLPPVLIKKPICKKCAYYDLCFI